MNKNKKRENLISDIGIIIKLKKNIVPIKVINSISKINENVCSKAYLEGCNFINDSDNKND